MNGSFIDRLLDWLMPLFANWGYLIVFAGVFFESIFLTGWIAPGTTVILIASFFAAQGELNIFMVWATSVVAALLGDNVGYFIGRRMGQAVVDRAKGKQKLRKRMERSQRFFERYGGITVLFGRMISGVDAFIPLTAGMNGMPYWKYMAYDIPGAILWSGIFCAVGYFFGNNWRTIEKVISWFGWGVLAILAGAFLVFVLIKRHRKEEESLEEERGDLKT